MYKFLQILHRHETTRPELTIHEHLLDPLVGEIDLINEAAGRRGGFGACVIFACYKTRSTLRATSHGFDQQRNLFLGMVLTLVKYHSILIACQEISVAL